MPEVELTDRFKNSYAELPEQIKKKVKKAIRLLINDPRHPSLQTKPIQGARGIYEARADQAYRMTYERLPSDVLRLRTLIKHNETLKNP